MEPNSMYYTFSSIAQVLAAFIALSGVFFIYKLQNIKKLQLANAQYFHDFIIKAIPRQKIDQISLDRLDDLKLYINSEQVELAATNMGEMSESSFFKNENSNLYSTLKDISALNQNILGVRKFIEKDVLKSLRIGAYTIVAAIIALPFVPLLIYCKLLSIAIIICIISGSAFSIFLMVRSILKSLGH